MNVQTTVSRDYERVLINIVRALPPHRVAQLVDFARFLEAQILSEELMQGEDVVEIEADNARWDALLATDEAQALLEELADEALAEHRAGKTKPRITKFEIVGDYVIRVTFDDETEQTINFEPVLQGHYLGPLKDLELFNKVRLDSDFHTLVWPNDADFDPATLYDWNRGAGEELVKRASERRDARC